MGYQQTLQLDKKITEKTEAFDFLSSLIKAVAHIASLISLVFQKSEALGAIEIKVYESDDATTEKARSKAKLVELASKMLQVSVSTIYLIYMVIINVNREHESALKQVTDKAQLAEE